MDITDILKQIISPTGNKPAKVPTPSQNAIAELLKGGASVGNNGVFSEKTPIGGSSTQLPPMGQAPVQTALPPPPMQAQPQVANAPDTPTDVATPDAASLIAKANAPQTIESTTPVQPSGNITSWSPVTPLEGVPAIESTPAQYTQQGLIQQQPQSPPVAPSEPPTSQLFQTPSGQKYYSETNTAHAPTEEEYLKGKLADAQSYRPSNKLANIGGVVLQSLSNSLNGTKNPVMTLDQIRQQRETAKYAPRLQQIAADQAQARAVQAAQNQATWRDAQTKAEVARATAEVARTDAEKIRGQVAQATADKKPYLDQWEKSASFDPVNNADDKAFAAEAANHGVVLKPKSPGDKPGHWYQTKTDDGHIITYNRDTGEQKVSDQSYPKPEKPVDTTKGTTADNVYKKEIATLKGKADGYTKEIQDLGDSNAAAKTRLAQLDLTKPADVEEWRQLKKEIADRDAKNVVARRNQQSALRTLAERTKQGAFTTPNAKTMSPARLKAIADGEYGGDINKARGAAKAAGWIVQ